MRLRLAVAVLTLASLASAQPDGGSEWPHYGNDAGGARYSPASQIDRTNVAQLQVAWTFRTGALGHSAPLDRKAAFEATPILVDGKLFLSTPYNHVIALDPRTGARLWEYDAALDRSHDYSEVTSRGVAAWRDTAASPGAPCRTRILMGTLDARLIALDAETGTPCAGFGASGQVDLTRGVDLRDLGNYQMTSAPAVSGDVIVVGSSIGDNRAVDVERGIVRGFDARTGALRWTWDPIPWASRTTPRTGAGNAWSTLSVDAERGLVFVPTGSASPDFWGGTRKGDNRWANSVVALRAATGELVWGFQVVHHDLWDYDVASQPTLFSWRDGTPAIAITTKMGRVFVLDRVTGAPLLPVEERPAPPSDVPGEEAWPTQPSSGISVVPESLRAEDAWGSTEKDRAWCREKIAAARSEGIFTPPSLRGTVVFPGNVGGVNWGSSAYDPTRHLLFMNTNRLATLVRLIPHERLALEATQGTSAERLRAELALQAGTPYAMRRAPLLSPGGTPCNPPPWGTLVAVDLFSGRTAWDVPLGSVISGDFKRLLVRLFRPALLDSGSPNLGGPIATAGGLVFTAASMDNHLRAFDSDTGRELWKYELPAGGQATPMTYRVDGRQYIVIAAGGHGKLGTKLGDYVVAFTLP
ncbi:MAG TPA: pyrroloquinoline quinone-dependent dehydrogenase [Methylomirabilota bacterium]|nr:pyrroloquinoline quinone-dependent dehydrogenase [Methylomirabilota bacterium]